MTGRNGHDRRAVAEAARDATFRFLGRLDVCGVGMTHQGRPRISFLLRRDTAATRSLLARWATEQRVEIEIAVAPPVQPTKR